MGTVPPHFDDAAHRPQARASSVSIALALARTRTAIVKARNQPQRLATLSAAAVAGRRHGAVAPHAAEPIVLTFDLALAPADAPSLTSAVILRARHP